jgi:heptosyltransferase-3
MKVVLTAGERRRATARWIAAGLPPGALVVGALAGGRGDKRRPLPALLDTVARLRERGTRVAVLVGPEERALLPVLRRTCADGVIVVPPLGLREFAAMLAGCAVVVTPDCGPMHLAVALGVPTHAVLQSVSSLWYRPLGRLHRALYDPSGVPVATVVTAAESMLSASSAVTATG